MGDFEAGALASVESSVKYHPGVISALTAVRNPAAGHCQVGSLTGAVASNWGSPAATLEALSGCLLGHPSLGSWNRNPLPIHNLERKHPALLVLEEGSENASGADNQQGSLRDPSTTVRRTSHWDGETV